jgi:hypothetical protein
VLRTFHLGKYPIRHFWGVPIYCHTTGYDVISGFAWDIETPTQRRVGFPSWSWSGWMGQVKDELLVKLDQAPAESRGDQIENFFPPIPSAATKKSVTVETPQNILQVNLPDPVNDDITLRVERIDGTPMPYLQGSLQYFEFGGLGLSHFLSMEAWMAPATFSTSGAPKVTISSSLHRRGHDSLQWLPTQDETIDPGTTKPERVCTGILLAVREPLYVDRHPGGSSIQATLKEDYDFQEGEVMNNSWLCLFLIVEAKGVSDNVWHERIGLAKFLISDKLSKTAVIQDLMLERRTIRLG